MSKLANALTWLWGALRRFWTANAAARYGMAGRTWIILTGPVTIIVLAHAFTPVLQGYFVTFMSLAAARTLAELGLGQVIIVEVARAIHASSEHTRTTRVAGLVRFSGKWFAAAGLLAGLVLAGLGGTLLGARGVLPTVQWLPAWLATSALVGVDVGLSGLMFPLEGAGFVQLVYFCRMVRSIINSLVLWLGILLGLGLWCVPAGLLASLVWAVVFLLSDKARLIADALRPGAMADKVSWLDELFPLQWQLALSTASDFVTFYTLVPFAYLAFGPVTAGQLGLTWQLAVAVSAIASAVVAARFPEFSRLVAIKAIKKLDELAVATAITTQAVCTLGAVSAGLGILFLNLGGYQLAARLLPFPEVLILLLGILIWHLNATTVSFLRAHGGDPFLPGSLGAALLTGLAEVTVGRWFGPAGLLWVYVLIGAGFAVPMGLILARRMRRKRGYPPFSIADNHLFWVSSLFGGAKARGTAD